MSERIDWNKRPPSKLERDGRTGGFVDRNSIDHRDKILKALKAVRLHAQDVADEFKALPGGDGYRCEASSNQIEDLKEALAEYEFVVHTDGTGRVKR